MKRKQFLQALAFTVPLVATIGQESFSQTKDNQKVVMGQIGLSFYQVKGALIQTLLEEMGYTVEVKEGLHESIFPLLNSEEIDLLVAAWLPEAHASYWQEVENNAVQLSTLYDNAFFFWGVPDYIPENEVKAIADLAKPDVAAKMNKTIQGIGQGASITVFSENAIGEYGLDKAGYQLLTGTATDWISAFETAVTAKEWTVLPTWQPQYLNRAYNIRQLEDPLGILGSENQGTLIATKAFVDRFPPSDLTKLRRIKLDIATVNNLDYQVNVEQKTPKQAAKEWIEANGDRFNFWLAN